MAFPLLRRGQLTNVAALMGGAAVASTDNTVDLVNDGTAWRTEQSGASLTIASVVSGITAGNLLFVQVKCETNTQISTCTDNVGGTYTRIIHHPFSNTDGYGAVFVCLSALPGITTITAQFAAGTATFRKIQPIECACFTPAIVDAFVSANGSSTAPNSTTLDTSSTGFVMGFYFNYNSVAVSGCLNGTKSGWNAPEVNTTFMQAWGTQRTSVPETIAASCTLASSGVWICAAIAIEGSGARTSTANNYAHQYWNFTALADATQLTAANIAASQSGQGNVASQYSITTTGTGAADLTVKAGVFTLNKPLVVLGVTKGIADAHKGFGIAHSTGNAPTYIVKNINRHRRIRITGFIKFGPTNGAGTDLFDFVTVHSAAGHTLDIMQLNRSLAPYNFNIEAIVSGSTTHSTGFTPTSGGSYSFCFWVNIQSAQFAIQMWDSGNVKVLDETGVSDATLEDIDLIRLGNAEAGVQNGTTTIFEHIAVNFDTDVMAQP